MLNLATRAKIFICTEPTDMRKSFDGLAAMVTGRLAADPLSGHLFVFINKRGDRVKILYWDRDGLALWYKRLESGTFCIPQAKADDALRIELSSAQLAMLLEGIEPIATRRRRRYARNDK